MQFVRDYKRDQRGTEIEGSGVSWLVFGPAELVVSGEVVEVKRMDEGITFVQVLDILAERLVKKRNKHRSSIRACYIRQLCRRGRE